MTEIEKLWKELNSYGIYTMKDFNKAVKENEFNIGIFTTPLNSTSSKEQTTHSLESKSEEL